MDIRKGLEELGIKTSRTVYRNLPAAVLIEKSLASGDGILASNGALVVKTGERTGRSPNDKFIAEEPSIKDRIAWGKVNVKCPPEQFGKLLHKAYHHLSDKDIYVFDGFAGADPKHRLAVRVITETIWHCLFAQTLFIRPTRQELENFTPGFTVMGCGSLKADPSSDGTKSSAFVGVSFEKKINLVIGSMYGGEIKKSIFSIMNFLMPQQNVFPMHCSANLGKDGAPALFFGLSGTGKTTLSADPNRRLVGDDEHGWSDAGIFNFEGGCYAKVIRLSPEAEPQIYATTRKFGTVLENVVFDPRSRRIDLDDGALTENTRAAYPLSHIDNSVREGTGGHPRNVVMLTADAFGVLPPIARMNLDQAMYHFLSGYTAKVAGTERGVTEPFATFSACFGAPFLTLPPAIYAGLLREKVEKRGVDCWLVNTGWTGGPFGEGRRMAIAHTRAMLNAALGGKLDGVEMRPDPVFGLDVPASCEGVPPGVLDPRSTWRDTAAYDKKAGELAARFAENFEQYRGEVSAEVIAAGPRIA